MHKCPSSTQAHGRRHKRSKSSREKSQVVSFVSLEAEVASEDKDSEGEEDDDVSDNNIVDDESDDNVMHPSSSLKDVGAWDIFREHLTTNMSFEEMLEKLRAVKNVLKGWIQRAWLQLVCCAPYPKRKQQRTTRGRGRAEDDERRNSSQTEEGMSRV
ncbi:uncharacterized protein F5147DRAFT_780744 [Suillus discolor]|uniref:Uncharacterized protein n=1 Tax=Suillus discolor TaxID=1912936 RepID=A0A9P7JMB8_9AGAM|nr:uncharacterized protein F5147DRAFT_780744 [Suillus discolor]KAG2089144.1 hypothetical protein F5147DRAFT_780744 [Suillus discolor]